MAVSCLSTEPYPVITTAGSFPVGFHQLHPDTSMNFQMNRWFTWVGEQDMLDEMRAVAPRIASYADWKREFLALAENASQRGHMLRAGFYFRSANFFMRPGDPDRKSARDNFVRAVRSVYGLDLGARFAIPYADGHVEGLRPAYRFTPPQSTGTIIFFGGFDNYIEELTSPFVYLRDAGYEVIAFEGPGQGGALDEVGLPLTAAWHKPVKTVLDYFAVDRLTLVGLSMGGCLVVRAAAFEPRVERVVAYDIYPDALDVNIRQVNPLLREMLNAPQASRVDGCERDGGGAGKEKCRRGVGDSAGHARDRDRVAVRIPANDKAVQHGRRLDPHHTVIQPL